jgi:tricorn protease
MYNLKYLNDMNMKDMITKVLSLVLFLAFTFHTNAKNDSRLLRFPDINNNLVAFVYAGDIWSVSSNGGDAKRLTSHEGLELFPKISPNGTLIAFSAEYSGSRQIFVMPVEGGIPKQLTYYNSVGQMPPRGGFDNVVLDWTADSKNILIRSNRTEFGERSGKYFLVNVDGGLEQELQIVNGGFAALSPDAKKICFTPVDREFRSWKRYKGGRATELWVYDLEKDISEQITHFAGSDQWPVWDNNMIYFASDRDLKFNIYSYNTDTKEVKQITNFTDFDVMWPSGENGQLIFENGGLLYKTNLKTGTTEKLSINLHFDNPNVVPYFKNVAEDIHSYSVSQLQNVPYWMRVAIFFRFRLKKESFKTLQIRRVYGKFTPAGRLMESTFHTIRMPPANTKFICWKTKKEQNQHNLPKTRRHGNTITSGRLTANTCFIPTAH